MITDMLSKKVNIPVAFRELHGERATVADLLFTYGTGIVIAAAVLLTADTPLPFEKRLLLGLLVMDIAGGVTANFTRGTNAYYGQRPRLRFFYVLSHTLQPVVLMWLFPEEAVRVAVFAGYALLSALFVNSIRSHWLQRLLAAMLTACGVFLLHFLSFTFSVLAMILTLYLVKLVLAFAVRWDEAIPGIRSRTTLNSDPTSGGGLPVTKKPVGKLSAPPAVGGPAGPAYSDFLRSGS